METIKIGQYYRNVHTKQVGRVTAITSQRAYLEAGTEFVGSPTRTDLKRHWTLVKEPLDNPAEV